MQNIAISEEDMEEIIFYRKELELPEDKYTDEYVLELVNYMRQLARIFINNTLKKMAIEPPKLQGYNSTAYNQLKRKGRARK
jgi:hypothetical protein